MSYPDYPYPMKQGLSEVPYPLINLPVVSSITDYHPLLKEPPTLVSLYSKAKQKDTDEVQEQKHKQRSGHYLKVAVYTTIAFIILSQPKVYEFTNMLYSKLTGNFFFIVTDEGVPTILGIATHALLFFLLLLLLQF